MQVRYAMQMIDTMVREGLGAVECRREVHDRYIAQVDAIHENMVWTHPGTSSYYRNSKGRVVVNSPYRNVDFFEMTKAVDLGDYLVEPREGRKLPERMGRRDGASRLTAAGCGAAAGRRWSCGPGCRPGALGRPVGPVSGG